MDDTLRNWHPSDEEIETILAEMRPIIQKFAARDAALSTPSS
jgi:hypothetical protein